jgi:hypothetical protein
LVFVVFLPFIVTACGASDLSPSVVPSPTGSPAAVTVAPTPLRTFGPDPRLAPLPSPTPAVPLPLPADLVAANTTGRPVRAVSAGWNACAIKQDGGLTCWPGSDTPLPSGRFVALDNGPGSTCAIDTDGALRCWGEIGQRVPNGRFTSVSVQQSEACAIRTDGTVACWVAFDPWNEPSEPLHPPKGQFSAVSVGEEYACGLHEDGTLACWSNWEEELPAVPEGTFTAVDVPCAIRSGGALECFGYRDGLPPPMPDGTFTAVSSAGWEWRGCALRADGTLACWGTDGYDDEGDTELPMQSPAGTYVSVTVGEEVACAQRLDGRAVCWGQTEGVRPAPTMLLLAPRWVAASEIKVSWSSLPLFAPVERYDIRYALNPDWDHSPVWVPLRTGTTKRHARVTAVTPGQTYCIEGRAIDGDGVASNWEGSCTTLPRDDTAFVASDGWVRIESPRFYGGSALMSRKLGATLELPGLDTWGVGILASTGTDGGQIKVWAGGENLGKASLWTPNSEDRRLVLWTDNGEDGSSGTLRIKVLSSGRPVIIDGVLLGPGPDD